MLSAAEFCTFAVILAEAGIRMWIAGKGMLSVGKRLLPVFCAGLIAGILVMNMGKSILLEDTGLFDEYTLYRMKYMTVDSSALFCYAFRKRMTVFVLVAVLATTYLGYVMCRAAAAWCGMSLGIFLTALSVRYGIKGLVLAAVCVFPQYLFYVPAVVMMLGWCESLYRTIYSRGVSADGGGKKFLMKELGRLGVIAALVILGCLSEGYVNPGLLTGYLKIF